MAVRRCAVSFSDVRGVRHSVEVEAESLYEAAVLAIRRFREDPWGEIVGPATVLTIEVREPSTSHAITLQQIERWLSGSSPNPTETMKKAKLKTLLVQKARR